MREDGKTSEKRRDVEEWENKGREKRCERKGISMKRKKMSENEKISGERKDAGVWEISGERRDLG